MPETPLIHRVLRRSGYALTAVLVLAAGGVLAWPVLSGGEPATGTLPVPSAEVPADPSEGPPQGLFPDLNGDNGQPATAREGDGPCGTQKAFYKRTDDGVEVTVVFPGVGAVRVVVVPTTGEPSMKSYTTAGDPKPHVFAFPDISSQAVEKVGLTVTTAGGSKDCELQRR